LRDEHAEEGDGMKPQDKKLLIGGGIGIAALVYFTRRRTADQGRVEFRPQHEHKKHDKNERGEYGKKKHRHKD
jgi:hypothetical protein